MMPLPVGHQPLSAISLGCQLEALALLATNLGFLSYQLWLCQLLASTFLAISLGFVSYQSWLHQLIALALLAITGSVIIFTFCLQLLMHAQCMCVQFNLSLRGGKIWAVVIVCKQSLGLLKCIIFFLLMFSPSYHKCLCISSQRCFPLKVNQGQLSSSMMLFHRGTLLRGHVSHGVDVMQCIAWYIVCLPCPDFIKTMLT